MDIELDRLRAFGVFASHLNFTHAAAELHITQPALHMQIKRLSEQLGVVLYRREGRGLQLTEAGVRVQRFAAELDRRAHDFAAELSGAVTSDVRLMAGEGAYLYLLGAAVRRFRRDRARLRLLTGNAEQTVAAVHNGRAELGVAALERPPADLQAQPLTVVGACVAMPKGHPLARRRSVRFTDLRRASLVLPPPGRPHRVAVAQALARADVDYDVAVEASGWELMLHFVGLGLGLAIVNSCCRMPRGVVSRPIAGLAPVRYYVLTTTSELRPPAVRLRALLLEHGDAWQS